MKKFSFVKNSKIFFAISLVMVVVTAVLLFTRGFNLDIEFVGGTELTYDIGRTVTGDDEAKIENAVKEIIGNDMYSKLRVVGDKKDGVVVRTKLVDTETDYEALNNAIAEAVLALDSGITVVSSGENNIVFALPATEEAEATEEAAEAEDVVDETDIKTAVTPLVYTVLGVKKNEEDNMVVTYDPNSEISILRGEITEGMKKLYEEEGLEVVLSSNNTVSAEVSDGLKKSAFLATFAAVLLMLIYIAFRFQISSAFASIVCLLHDVIMMIFAYLVFQIPVSSTIIAAVLTIVGYSINATIVIFDRVRENLKAYPGKSFGENIDSGIKSTLFRSLNTTITTLLTIGMVYILGVTSIKEFALPLIVGLLAGAYSSICLAGPLWNVFKKVGGKKK